MKRRLLILAIGFALLMAVSYADDIRRRLQGEAPVLTFDRLADWDYVMPPGPSRPGNPPPFPKEVLDLQGKRIVLEGFMVPTVFEHGRVRGFIVSRYIGGCCFGQAPKMTEWADVTLAEGETVENLNDKIVRVEGAFSVGEERDDHGYVQSLYRMEAVSVEATSSLGSSLIGAFILVAVVVLVTLPSRPPKA